MTKNTVVTYQIKPEVRDQHIALIQAVFKQLDGQKPVGLDYQVICLDDGVSFFHVATTEDGNTSALGQLPAFQEFNSGIAERVVTKPSPQGGNQIGSYISRDSDK